MKFTYLFIISLLFSNFSFGQKATVDNGNITIEIKKIKKAPTFFHTQQSVKVRGEMRKIMIKTRIKSKNKEDFDVNPISLIDTVNKVRYRLLEFVGYKSFSVGFPTYQGEEYLKTKLVNKKGRSYQNAPNYNPRMNDTFNDYVFEGYENIECEINFGTDKNPLLSVTYYAPITMNSFIADSFFAILNFEKKPIFELYYGNEKVADIEVKLK